jgi:hypothetical protein
VDRDEPLQGFDESKRRCLKRLRDFTIAGTALPWIAAIADEIVQAQGEDPFPYGIEASRPRWKPSAATATTRASPQRG